MVLIYNHNEQAGEKAAEKAVQVRAELALFNAQVDRYLTKKSVTKGRVPAHGRVIFVNERSRKVDKFDDLVPSMQPKDPSEVDSVILHKCDYVEVGRYANGARALQNVCEFTVIDVVSGAWSHWGEFKGTKPPSEIRRRRTSTSDENVNGGGAVYEFYRAGGLVTR